MKKMLVVVVLGLGCGPKAEGSSGTETEGSTEATSVGTDGDTTGPETGCPEAPPEDGSSCEFLENYPQCTWGDSSIPHCRIRGDCIQNVWSVNDPACDPMPPGCEDTPPVAGTECGEEGLACGYPDGTVCGCTSCPGACTPDPPQWYCSEPPGADCPNSLPNMGTPCPETALSCIYGSCAANSIVEARCVPDRVWFWDHSPCPQ